MKVVKSDKWLNKNDKFAPPINDGEKSHMKSPEMRDKRRLAMIGQGNPMYGKTHSEEHRAKISASGKGKTRSEKTKVKMRKPKPRKEGQKNKPMSDTHRKAIGMAKEGTIWINNGCINKRVKSSEIGVYQKQGFVLGQKKTNKLKENSKCVILFKKEMFFP